MLCLILFCLVVDLFITSTTHPTNIYSLIFATVEKMPTLKKLISNLHRELKLENNPTHVRETALSFAMATFGKTGFCNHLSFLSSCLRYKVIPIWFRLHFQCNFVEGNFLRNTYNKHLNQCSRNLMRSSIQTMLDRKHHFHNQIAYYKSKLNNSTNNLTNITSLLHTLNRRLYQHMKEVKTCKLWRFLPYTHTQIF